MGGRGASSASGAANVRKVRNFLRDEGFSVVFALQESTASGDFDEAWSNLMYGRGYPTDYAKRNRRSFNENKSRALSTISRFIGESDMSLDDFRDAVKKGWS